MNTVGTPLLWGGFAVVVVIWWKQQCNMQARCASCWKGDSKGILKVRDDDSQKRLVLASTAGPRVRGPFFLSPWRRQTPTPVAEPALLGAARLRASQTRTWQQRSQQLESRAVHG